MVFKLDVKISRAAMGRRVGEGKGSSKVGRGKEQSVISARPVNRGGLGHGAWRWRWPVRGDRWREKRAKGKPICGGCYTWSERRVPVLGGGRQRPGPAGERWGGPSPWKGGTCVGAREGGWDKASLVEAE